MRITLYGLVLLIAIAPTTARADFADIFKTIKPSVAYIVSALPDGAASGSGFVLSSDTATSEIVTANHVIEGASAVDVILNSDLSKRYHATVLRRDHVRDVAILEIPIGHLRALRLAATSTIEEGMSIAVVGYPRAAKAFERLNGDDLRPSVHMGTLSAIRLDNALYQFDAATDHGDSGGPVLNAKNGAVIGMVRGAVLDPAYLARGLELPLPGTSFAMSARTISMVARGDTEQQSPANSLALGSATTRSSKQHASSNYRVAFVQPRMGNSVQQSIVDHLSSRVAADLRSDNAFYMVPATVTADDVLSGRLESKCEDLRTNAVVAPIVSWQQTGTVNWYPYVGNIDTRRMAVGVQFLALDCSGAVIFSVTKRKAEGVRGSPDHEITDMANDLIDQAEKDFSAYRAEHAGAWKSLLTDGLFIDPSDSSRHALVSFQKSKDGHWRVRSVFRGGPADIAGLQVGDQIERIAGQNLDHVGAIDAMFDAESVALIVSRPSGTTTITVFPKRYADLLRMTGRNAGS